MKVVFRADASLQMGSGHVMRCLTLADALKAKGAKCHFISRAHPGHLLDHIRQRGFEVNCLPAPAQEVQALGKIINASGLSTETVPIHSDWLGCDWQTDAVQTADILVALQPDWLVTDHYALAQPWEAALKPHYKNLMVIDDLADRTHACDLLLDQNLGRLPNDYINLVPAACLVLTGPHYALLRPEFAELREYSLWRRGNAPHLKQLLITMGGVDQTNATGQVLQALKSTALPADCRITVVMGSTAPWVDNNRELAGKMPWPTEVVVNVNDMAQRMAGSDLAIGAAGSTSWERCCLGLPTLIVVLADNQRGIAAGLERVGAANVLSLNNSNQFAGMLRLAVGHFANNKIALMTVGQAAAKVTNGCGTNLVAAHILGKLA